MFEFRPSNWPYGYTRAGQLPGGGVILRPGISVWPIPGSSLGYFGETETYDGVPQPVPAPAPGPAPIYVAPTPSPIKTPLKLPPPIPYQTQMDTPYGVVRAPTGRRVTGTAKQQTRESLEESVVRARIEESTYRPEFSVPSKLAPPETYTGEPGAPKIHAGGIPSSLPVKQVEAPPTLVEPEEKPEQLQKNIEYEMNVARQHALKEARRQWELGRGSGHWLCGPGIRGSCTDEAWDLYNAIKKGGPYKYIGFSQVRRFNHSAVAVYPKGRGNKYDSQMIVFDPYKSKIMGYWKEEPATAWQGGLIGMWKYKGADYTVEDKSP